MNVKKIASNITIRPTNKKMREARQAVDSLSVLPKEMPVEKKIYLQPLSETFERIKDNIQINIEKMRGQR